MSHPDQLTADAAEWIPAEVPGTVASALQAAGRWDFAAPIDLDAFDWWFLADFSVDASDLDHPCWLCFDGLATLAEVWLNGEAVLAADNMFRSFRVDVSSTLRTKNELAIVFRSLKHDLQRKRPRPRWKTNLVQHQQLRWHRTSLLGRIPGWSPPVPPIGPWREIRLETGAVQLHDRSISTRCDGDTGIVSVNARIVARTPLSDAELRVGGSVHSLDVFDAESEITLSGEVQIANPPLWWPHTHGDPKLLPCEIVVTTIDREQHRFPCGEIGFRNLEADTGDGGFGIRINGVPIFCRGACWTVNDIFTLTGSEATLERDLRLARDAGVNLLRVTGTMVYESDVFYRLCDRLGILVWQDFQFANMDYPVHDESFRRNITAEATQQLRRLSAHPSVAVYCGNSEIEQQAAMLGLPRELWRNEWFAEDLPALCAARHPGTAYVPSTPTGGALPFQANEGLTHYYGVGAYLRSIEDVRRADVRFTPECLGFSHIPEPAAMEAITGGALPVPHSPQWKQRIPRDTGAGWDFEDVRDHYLKELFGVDPVGMRSRNLQRYLQLSRVVPGAMLAQTFAEWRSCHSRNQGALVWFYKDLWPAAGWGVLDSTGFPKAAYYFLKRLWQPRQLTMTDEGLNGLHLHLTNESDEVRSGFVEVLLLREPNTAIAHEEVPVTLPPRSRSRLSADEILGRFYDVSYAYRFGPPQHDVAIATWYSEDRSVIGEAFHVIERREPAMLRNAAVECSAHLLENGGYEARLRSDSFLHFVRLDAPGYLPGDNYFHLIPGRTKAVRFEPWIDSPRQFRAEFDAVNLDGPQTVTISHRPV